MADRDPSPDPADEHQALVHRCLQHDRAAWDTFVEQFSKLIYSVVHRTLRRHGQPTDGEAVDELFHAAFAALYINDYRKLRQWNGRCSLPSWIRLVTGSVVVDKLRRRRPTVPIDPDDAQPLPDLVDDRRLPLQLLRRAETIRRVRAALQTLSEPDRDLLDRLYNDHMSPAEVATALGIKPGALYTRKNRALGRLRQALEADGFDPG